ncbi:MAG TPA: beta-ketoacyl-ACP synthase II [Actinomycetota bacterium]|nr:beta-ketoacyl-ACP synthase II [Actinomycetota bacterium]
MTDAVVTGLGLVTPIGIGVEAVWDALVSGRSGAAPVEGLDVAAYETRIACQVHDFDPTDFMGPREAGRCDRFAQMAVAAGVMAWEHAGLDDATDRDRTGVVVGSGIGGLYTIEQQIAAMARGGPRRVSPFTVPMLMPNAAPAAIAMRLGLRGVNHCVASACATGAHAIGEALLALRAGRADVVLAGGSEATITPLALAAFARMGALSTRNDDPAGASRPFDAGRDGFVCGEGAAVLVLETEAHARRRGARAIARLAGYGASADAFHLTQPDPEGDGAVRAMTMALDDAGVTPQDVDYVNAHGTSTPYNDRVETLALKRALGTESKRIPVTSTKSQTGHLLGAAGALEAAATALIIERGIIPRTLNLEDPDPECDLDYVPGEAREERVGVALSNSFGFGGQNACLVLRAS